MRLVADHELVGGRRELVAVAGEPGVGLDRERVRAERLAALLDRVGEALAVALGREVAAELVDEQPAVREDQDAELAGRLDEPGSGDRLARRGRVTEAIAPRGAGILADERLVGLLVDELEILVLLVVLLLDELRDAPVRASVAVLLDVALGRRDQLGQHPGECVDLVAPQRCARGRRGRLGREHPLEAEHQAVAHLPDGGGDAATGVDLLDRVVERPAARGPGSERDVRLLARVEERLAEPAARHGARRAPTPEPAPRTTAR